MTAPSRPPDSGTWYNHAVDVVFHNVAHVPLVRDPNSFIDVNTRGTLNLLETAREGAGWEQIVEFAGLGGYVEICALGLMPLYLRITPNELKKIIQTVGANRCILTSDYAFEWSPSGPEILRMLIASLLEAGVKAEEIAQMAQVNPKTLLNLK